MENADNHFADKLNRLFQEKKKPDGTRYSKKEVLEGCPGLTRLYLWRLQTGKVARPSYEIVKALADFFEVQPDYFFEAANEAGGTPDPREEELKVLLRTFGLGKDEQRAVFLMIESLKKSKE